ncbi:hypothetical protein [Kibdelosporangium philippinense]|uniref:hypothetical protein n=1 Tax=Kibdelosporangium philippinense TaxID=211113 RepID=UPI00361A890C
MRPYHGDLTVGCRPKHAVHGSGVSRDVAAFIRRSRSPLNATDLREFSHFRGDL